MANRKRKYKGFSGIRDMDFRPPPLELAPEIKRGILIVFLFAAGAILLLSLVDLAGALGLYLNNFLKLMFGANRWYWPAVLIIIGYFLLRPAKYVFKTSNVFGLLIFIFGFNGLIHLLSHQNDLLPAAKAGLGGGFTGLVLAYPFLNLMGPWAALIAALALTLIGFFLLFNVSFAHLSDKNEEVKGWWEKANDFLTRRRIKKIQEKREKAFHHKKEEAPIEAAPEFLPRPIVVEVEQQGFGQKKEEKKPISEEEKSAGGKSASLAGQASGEYKQLDLGVDKFKRTKIDLPFDLLDGRTTVPKGGDLKANQLIIQKTLENFGIPAEMGEAQVGPTVTQYTLKPAEGVKLSRITALGDNLALALAAHPIRIEAPIPGRSLVGIEVPNQATAIVPLRDIVISESFKNRKSNLTVVLGKDVMGKPWLAELDKMPHLLIAGATGSGKSVCINTLILSLLYQNGPGDLKFIMVDPKRVELPIYNGIPHLLTPVITDVRKTINSLRWAIAEMEKRFDLLSAARHRNIASYNSANAEKMPYIVIVIDELADLMAAAGAEVEAAIVRLAQMSRAVGIHLVLATQRPSVDVITGLIKANITSRIAFSVASLVDSRTILDMAGAEKLLGRGDMLYISAEISKPKRLQGAFASDEEIKRVADYLKDRTEPDYVEEVVEKQQVNPFVNSGSGDGEDSDPLVAEAKEVILQAKKASASLLQRRLRVGYARAARILDLLEAQGVIGPGEGAKPREILVSGYESDTYQKDDEEEVIKEEEPEEKVEEEEEEDNEPEEKEREYLEE